MWTWGAAAIVMSGGRQTVDVVVPSQLGKGHLLQLPRVEITLPAFSRRACRRCRRVFGLHSLVLILCRSITCLIPGELPDGAEPQHQQRKWGEKSNAILDRHTDPASEADSYEGQVLEAFLAELLPANGDGADAARTRVD